MTVDTEDKTHEKSEREEARDEMLEAALARPGVREVMEVYYSWWEKDRALDAYREATKMPERWTTTDRSNPD